MNVERLTCFAFAFAAAALAPALAHAQAGQCSLIAHVDGFRNEKGVAGATLFRTPDGWPESNDKSFKHAFAVIHDENENRKMDRNMLGIPKEGFGFANNPHVALTTPSFDAASVEVACPSTEITVHLQYK